MDNNSIDVEEDLPTHDDAEAGRKWAKGMADPDADSRINIWSLNGFGDPVFTGGMYQPDEARILKETVKNYCASKNVTLSKLCGGEDHIVHDKEVRGAWQEIAQCLPHRTVLSVYRRALRQFHTMSRGAWTKEETEMLFRLVELHGHKWTIIQDKLGRSAVDCRVKFFNQNDQFQRGKWSAENIELLLKSVRSSLHVPNKDMDVREINQWTLKQKTKIPWTSISCKVNRKRQDCYYKWKQMTKRSNRKAAELGMEPIPMARESLKFDVRENYCQWKAEQGDPKWRQKYTDDFVLPLLQKEKDGNSQEEHDIELLNSVVASHATRPSEVSWHSFVQRGFDPQERWEELADNYARDDDLDLPVWKLAKVVKDRFFKAGITSKTIAQDEARNGGAIGNNDDGEKAKKPKKQKKKKKKEAKDAKS